MSDIQKIIDLAKKLHNLATNNPNENEAISAAEKLQALLAEHALSMADLTNVDDPLKNIISDNHLLTDRAPWIYSILGQCAKLYFCGYFHTTFPAEWVKRHKLDKLNRRLVAGRRSREFIKHTFVGTAANIIVAKNVAEYIISTGEALCKEGRKAYPREEHARFEFSFVNAFSARVAYRLQERRLATSRDGIHTEKTNLPALQSVYNKAQEQYDMWLSAQAIKLKSGRKLEQLKHLGGALAGMKAGESIGLDMQIDGAKATPGRQVGYQGGVK